MDNIIAPITIDNHVITAPIFVGQSGRGFVDRGTWSTGLQYYPLDFFQNIAMDILYITRKLHVSTTIANDIILGNITEIINIAQFISQVETLRDECIVNANYALNAVENIDSTVYTMATNLINTQAIIAQYHAFA